MSLAAVEGDISLAIGKGLLSAMQGDEANGLDEQATCVTGGYYHYVMGGLAGWKMPQFCHGLTTTGEIARGACVSQKTAAAAMLLWGTR